MKRRAILLLGAMGAALLLVSGVALAESVTCDTTPPCYGTPEDDQIIGTDASETIYAYGGDDVVGTLGGDDTVYGSSGDYDLRGSGGSNKLYGGGGADILDADGDIPGSTDHIYGGRGNDRVSAADGNVDIINCGGGTDTVEYDAALDKVKSCETKTISG